MRITLGGKRMVESDKSMYVRIELAEKTLEGIDRRLVILEDGRITLERIATVTEMHIKEIQKREDKQEIREERQEMIMNNLATALGKINENLNKLNSGQSDLEKRIGKIEDNSRLDIMQIIKNIIWIGIPAAVLIWLGLK